MSKQGPYEYNFGELQDDFDLPVPVSLDFDDFEDGLFTLPGIETYSSPLKNNVGELQDDSFGIFDEFEDGLFTFELENDFISFFKNYSIEDSLVGHVLPLMPEETSELVPAEPNSVKTRKFPKKALAVGDLIESLKISDTEVKLILKEAYKNSRNYVSINHALYRLYQSSAALQEKFEQPELGISVPCLKLKSDHEYGDDQSVFDALIPFTSLKLKLNLKAALAAGDLLERVEIEGTTVKLILKEEYEDPRYYVSLNKALYDLYRRSASFQEKFEQVKQGQSAPFLKLKSSDGYADEQSLFDALISFASSKEKLDFKAALAAGDLLERVEMEGTAVRLILKEAYDKPTSCASINQALYDLYRNSAPFQDKFEKPKASNSELSLKLKSNHGYADDQSVLNALINFASPKEKLNLKAALAAGDLLERVEMEGTAVKLILKEAYNNQANYYSINQALYYLFQSSASFQEKFEQVKQGQSAPFLKLKSSDGYADEQSLFNALISFASSKEKLDFKAALAAGNLLERVEIEDTVVKLILKGEYDHPAHYPSINQALYHLYLRSTAFQDKFEQPKLGKSAPCLKLKSNHGYADNQSVLKSFISFASPKKRLNVQEALASGDLLEGVVVEGTEVKLILASKYDNPTHYISINKSLNHLYGHSAPFREKFEQPKRARIHPV